jgi:hypothetical protein
MSASESTTNARPRDLSRRLTLFGIVAMAIGGGFVVVGLLSPVLAWAFRLRPEEQAVDWGSSFMGLLLYVALGVVLIWAGFGSVRRRRWVRPIMLFVSGTWLIVGAFCLLLALWIDVENLLLALGSQSLAPAPEIVLFVRVFLIGASFLGGLVLPAAFFWAYRDPRVQSTCERHDPLPSWSDRCPTTVLAMSVALFAAGVLGLPLVIRPVVPIFGFLATGWIGAAALLVGMALCLWLARSTYRLERIGWWGTLIFLILLGVSTLWSSLRIESIEIYRHLGYPESQLQALEQSGMLTPAPMVWGTVILTILGVAYMLAIRHHFK